MTIWNKEEPPKSVLKLYATMAAASRALDGDKMADSFFVASSYLSTATVLYKRGGFTPDEIAKLRAYASMSWDEIYSPGFFYDGSETERVLKGYEAQFFSTPANGPPGADNTDAAADPTGPDENRTARRQTRRRRAALDRDGPACLAQLCQRRVA